MTPMLSPTQSSPALRFGQFDPSQHGQEFTQAETEFRQSYPTYNQTEIIDLIRQRDFSRLDEQGHIYLDYTGGGLYAESQVMAHMEMMRQGVFGNPHSHNPTSQAMTDLVEQARDYVHTYFRADPDEYMVVFTANASGALKLVGESYPFKPGSRYLIMADNHNSVNGIREFARSQGAEIVYVPVMRPDMRLAEDELPSLLETVDTTCAHLFAYPAQSNYTGVHHDLRWIERAQAQGWDVLLDAAAFAPTNRLDLSRWHPDFVTLSFYKIFGYPTGLGALIARRETVAKLRRPWFAGGTVSLVSVQANSHRLASNEAAFEDGTLNYLGIPGIEIGLRYMDSLGSSEQKGVDIVHERVSCLTGWLLDQLTSMRHSNGAPLVQVYGPLSTEMRGGTLSLLMADPDGIIYDVDRIEELANQLNISVRTGCFCNPGAGEIAKELTVNEMRPLFDSEKDRPFHELRQVVQKIYHVEISSIRVSVGLVSNFADVYQFVHFVRSFVDCTVDDIGPAKQPASCPSLLRDGV